MTDTVQDGITSGETTQIYLGEPGALPPKETTLQVAHVDQAIYQIIKGEYGVGLFAGYQVTEKKIVIER